MNFFDILSLLGGLAMFLYGMRLMGDSLKENSSGALKVAMEHVTDNPVKAFLLGALVTALVQSSTAVIVITSGLVGAGILTLHQSVGIIIGANVGTTVTGQIIRLLDLDASGGVSWLRFFQPATLSSIALIAGTVIIMSGCIKNARSIGNIAIGFGVLFAGLLNMTGAVNTLSQSGIMEDIFSGLGSNPVLGYITGAGVAFVLQSSSATIGILQAFSATGMLTFKAIYAVIVGIYLGDCVTTAIVCSIGAEPDAKRVGVVHILFNLSKTALILTAVALIHRMGLLDSLWDQTVNSGIIANTNTVFNLSCAVCLLPLLETYEKLSRKIVPDRPEAETKPDKYKERIDALNPNFFNTPALALNSCYEMLLTIFTAARDNIEKSFRLLDHYDETLHQEILSNEDDVDRLTDHLNRYTMELLSHVQQEYHVTILDQYYKIMAEFERLGDRAVHVAQNAKAMQEHHTAYSPAALAELHVLEEVIKHILDLTEVTFRKRSLEAAHAIEPHVQVVDEIITVLNRHNRERVRNGICKVYADTSFTSLMLECKRMSSICSNVGVSTVVRVNPLLADHEHQYYEGLRSGGNEEYNTAFEAAHALYFDKLEQIAPQKQPES